ncbi:DUF72 domain-containing protein [Ramlibacter sp. AW1]|uniref:DUF72 domain-containing protein n=1 Tax=Ramlibacter aurantiacus TaxID=2801330 RepID=A0A937CZZ0_9BURK|nr:DUF72 domain-containing protein [Ramlibacter aurantiacus]MBL0418864.1 DUF72 domain-containing protein [Ramlibacter aurantiacus]
MPPTASPPAAVRIGVSGWRYPGWRGNFYPAGVAQARELHYASRQFSSIELNGSFYSLQRPSSYARWAAETPPGFVFTVKGARYLTHMLRLRNAAQALGNFFASGLFALGDKLGPILWQFPANFAFDQALFEAFFSALPRDTVAAARVARQRDERMQGRELLEPPVRRALRHAVEVRHASFATPGFMALLRRHGIAWVVADTPLPWPSHEDVTADFVYLRLHGSTELYNSHYSAAEIARWAACIQAWRRGRQPADARLVDPAAPGPRAPLEVFCYFDNTDKLHAPVNARELMQALDVHWPPSGEAATPRRR